MAGFNSMPTLPSGAKAAADALGISVDDVGQPSFGIEGFDQELSFDETILDNVNNLPPLPFTPAYDLENFSTTFEDPFSYSTARPFEAVPDPEMLNGDASSPQELDNKLLGFSPPLIKTPVVSETGHVGEVIMTAELFGMFFVAEDVYTAENTGRPMELTCYRRNLWQCSGHFNLPRHIRHVIDEQGRQLPILELAASMTCIESIDGKTAEIIAVPWKSTGPAAAGGGGGGGGGGDDAKAARAPANIPIDLGSSQEAENGRVTVPVAWKRLQFKHATANNGRRKGLQQHYVVQISLVGRTESGEWIKMAEIQSGPVIVRGRSPRNFDSRKDQASSSSATGAGGEKRSSEKRSTDNDHNNNNNDTPTKQDKTDLAHNKQNYHSLGNVQQSPADWTTPTPTPTPTTQSYNASSHPNKKVQLSPSSSTTRPPVPTWSSNESIQTIKPTHNSTPQKNNHNNHNHNHNYNNHNNNMQQPRSTITASNLPINLSLSEDERSPNRSTSDTTASPQFPKTLPSGGTHGRSESVLEDGEMLYEYFPLSLDDWMPPVDAIYRPHVVHHTVVPPDVKAQQVRNKAKRYFLAE